MLSEGIIVELIGTRIIPAFREIEYFGRPLGSSIDYRLSGTTDVASVIIFRRNVVGLGFDSARLVLPVTRRRLVERDVL